VAPGREATPCSAASCLKVGCIPSKAAARRSGEGGGERLAAHGVSFPEPTLDLDRAERFKSVTVARLTGGLAQMARQRKVEIIRGTARVCLARQPRRHRR